tara:strand:- start:9675 stop:10007 length:333 start_codon:yes stop_codon:yes gene_type:complete
MLVALLWEEEDVYTSHIRDILDSNPVIIKGSDKNIAYWTTERCVDITTLDSILGKMSDNVSWICIYTYDDGNDEYSSYIKEEHGNILEEMFYITQEIKIDPIAILDFKEY